MRKRRILVFIGVFFIVTFGLGFIRKKHIDLTRIFSKYPAPWGFVECDENGPSFLSVSPLALENLEFIQPMGAMGGSHVMPTDHTYWHLTNYTEAENQNYEIRAPADGNIVSMGNLTDWVVDGNYFDDVPYHVDYEIVIEHSCTLATVMIHVDKLVDEILAKVKFRSTAPGEARAQVYIPVKKGEILGWASGGKIDFLVADLSSLNSDFIFPKHYKSVGHRPYVVDPFAYFEEPLKSQLKDKSVRAVEPRGGRIAYDIEGRLIGAWFKENTRYYKGKDKERYWDGHLAIVYDYIFPDQIRITMGDWDGRSAQFAVIGNSPDPKDIGEADGIVKYEVMWYKGLMQDEHSLIGDPRNDPTVAERSIDNFSTGTILFQVLPDNKLKMENFPQKTFSEVSGFTSNSRIYER